MEGMPPLLHLQLRLLPSLIPQLRPCRLHHVAWRLTVGELPPLCFSLLRLLPLR